MGNKEKFYYRHDILHALKREYLAAKWQCSEAEALRTAVDICVSALTEKKR